MYMLYIECMYIYNRHICIPFYHSNLYFSIPYIHKDIHTLLPNIVITSYPRSHQPIPKIHTLIHNLPLNIYIPLRLLATISYKKPLARERPL